ncbi:MAG: glycosyltransferase family 4 protein [Pseudomonadota bacterium]
MKILLIHRYFWPDTPPYASMLRSIGKRLISDGHQVSVLSTQPSYKAAVSIKAQPSKEILDGMTVYRVTLPNEAGRQVLFRLFNMLYFPLRILWHLLFNGKYDVVMVSTAPPVVVGVATAIGAKLRSSKFFYHCMDIHPEIGALSGEFKNPLLFKLLRRIDIYSCNAAKAVIVLSEDMLNALESRPKITKRNHIILNNFALPDHEDVLSPSPELLKSKGKFRVLFAGNIGRFQGLELFVDAMAQLKLRPDIELVFLGEGSALTSLREQAKGLDNVIFLPHQSVGVAKAVIRDADLAIVSLSKDIYKYAYPSKTMTYLEQGCPLLVSVENESSLVEFVRAENIGVCVQRDSSQSIVDAISLVADDSILLDDMKSSATRVYENNFSERAVLDKWSNLFNESVGS